jgi:L-histidine N-alpha-methyltransferase
VSVTVDVHLTPADIVAALRDDARRGLRSHPKELAPKWFYDDTGSALFDAITRLAEYYPTRTERAILADRAAEIAALTGADTLVELGSGTSEKTRLLLDAMAGTGRLRRFMPFDVSERTLRDAAAAVDAEYPGVDVHAVVGDFERHLDRLTPATDERSRRVVAFLGGTIGNLGPKQRAAFFGDVAASMRDSDWFLLGCDLVKDPTRLVAAYDDAAGVTAAFNRNVLTVLNRELDANFAPERFTHVARWNAAEEWIEMWLRADEPMHVRIGSIDLDVSFAAGEEVRTEISAKFRRDGMTDELAAAGFTVAEWWTDPAADFAVVLAHI